MPIIDNRAPPTLQHDCTMFGHVGPCRSCIADAPRQAAQAASAAHPMRNVEVSPFAPPPEARTAAPTMGAYSSAAGRIGLLESLVENGALVGGAGAVNGLGAHAREAQDSPARDGRLYGKAAVGYNLRTFTRPEVLAVLKSRKVILEERPHFAEAVRELDALISVFERME